MGKKLAKSISLWSRGFLISILTLLFCIAWSQTALASTVSFQPSPMDLGIGPYTYEGFTFSVNAPSGAPMCVDNGLYFSSVIPALGLNMDENGNYVSGNDDFRITTQNGTKFQILSMQVEDANLTGQNYTISGYSGGTLLYSGSINFESPGSSGLFIYDCAAGNGGTITFSNWTNIDEITITGPGDLSLGVNNINYTVIPPTLTAGATATYTQSQSPVPIDPGLTVTDGGGSTLASATVAITGNFHASEDTLAFTNISSTTFGNITGSYDATAGLLTLTSVGDTATLAQWQAALQSVTYLDSSASPNTSPRTISYEVDDETYGLATDNATVNVTALPVVIAGATATYTQSQSPVPIDPGLTVTDGGGSTLASATVAITGNFHASEDILAFTNISSTTFGNITGSYNAATGVLTLVSAGDKATLAQWQAALQSVTYSDSSASPNTSPRTVSYEVNNGTNNSIAATATVLTLQTYSVTYDANGSTGSVPIDSSAYTSDQSVKVLSGSGLSNVGYNFAGWNTAANGGGQTYTPSSTLRMGNANVTLYAQWIPVLTLNPGNPSVGTVGNEYSYNFTTTGGTVAYNYAVTGGNLPDGLSLTTGGTLSGTPTTAGTFGFTIKVTDSENPPQSTAGTFSLTIAPAPVVTPQYTVNVVAQPTTGGTVTGGGTTTAGTLVTVTAGPHNGYEFVDWIVNNAAVSSDATYSFTVTTDETLAANFALIPPPPVITSISPTAGPTTGGTVVTIAGSGFSGATAVGFGSVPAESFSVTSDTTITAAAPDGSGSVAVTVLGPGGTSAVTTAATFTYTASSPTTPPTIAASYLSLGDSIAYGLNAAPGKSYADLLYNYLKTIPVYSSLSLNNLAVSGDTSTGLLNQLQTSSYQAALKNAKIVTVSIGGDNLLEPVIDAVGTAFGVSSSDPNFTTDLTLAMAANATSTQTILDNLSTSSTLSAALQAGVTQFAADFPQIISTIRTAAPQAQLCVLNLYNPVSATDPLYGMFNPLIEGINHSISSGATSGGYKVADVYTAFANTPGMVNFNLGNLELDPHPTTTGHVTIYQAILAAEFPQVPEATLESISVFPATASIQTGETQAYIATANYSDNSTQDITNEVSWTSNDNAVAQMNGNVATGEGSGGTMIQATYEDQSASAALTVTVPVTNHGGSNSSSSSGDSSNTGGSSTTEGQTTVTGNVVNGATSTRIATVTATVTTESNGNTDVSLNVAQALVLKQPNGIPAPFSNLSDITVSSQLGTKVEINSNGSIQMTNLPKDSQNTYNVTLNLGNGRSIVIGKIQVNVASNGQVSVTSTLIDPYGVVTDEATGQPENGVQMNLYYADTQRNIATGVKPNTLVPLPTLDGFAPNNNQNPQLTTGGGIYGFMVFPNTDYYIVASKAGYLTATSPTIAVGQQIVHWNMNLHAVGAERLAGLSRVDTALAIAKADYSNPVTSVVLVTAGNYPDALTGSVLAQKLNAPILLVGTSATDQAKVISYLQSNLTTSGTVYILGGTGAVSQNVFDQIKAAGFSNIERISGADRYATSVAIANTLNVAQGTPVVLASGLNYPDALAVSSVAALKGYPVLLVGKDSIPANVAQEIGTIKPSKIYIIGLDGAVGPAVDTQAAQAAEIAASDVVRIGGADRYATSLAVAKYFNLNSNMVCVATGSNFPDALAGSVYAAEHNADILLAGNNLSNAEQSWLQSCKPSGVTIFGGTGAVSSNVEQRLTQVIGQ